MQHRLNNELAASNNWMGYREIKLKVSYCNCAPFSKCSVYVIISHFLLTALSDFEQQTYRLIHSIQKVTYTTTCICNKQDERKANNNIWSCLEQMQERLWFVQYSCDHKHFSKLFLFSSNSVVLWTFRPTESCFQYIGWFRLLPHQ